MKAAIMDRYGSAEVFRIGELPLPEPGRREVRIAVRAASVNPIDWRIRSGSLRLVYPIRRPAVLGFDAAGVVDAVGEGVEGLSIGDNVYTRLDTRAGGAYGEAVVTPASAVARMPEGLGFEEAASLPLAALTAIQALRDVAGVRAGARVLINGASGGVGTLAVQIARAMELRVTGVCSGRNAEFVESLGAGRVIDYTKQDFTREGSYWEVIFDAAATRGFGHCRRALASGGTYVTTVPGPGVAAWMAAGLPGRLVGAKRAAFILMRPSGDDLRVLADWVASGAVRPILDSTFPLDRIAEAHRRSESKRARGKIVISIPR